MANLPVRHDDVDQDRWQRQRAKSQQRILGTMGVDIRWTDLDRRDLTALARVGNTRETLGTWLAQSQRLAGTVGLRQVVQAVEKVQIPE